jgi:cyclopropane fatty-acyl-phospholipid synthase-like methyltransferase
MAAPAKVEDAKDEPAAPTARPSFGARMKAWWHGEQRPPTPSNDDTAPEALGGATDASGASEEPTGESTLPASMSFKTRLKAWWRGVDVTELNPTAESDVESALPVKSDVAPMPAPETPAAPPAEKPPSAWTSPRIAAAERIWGAGLNRPGGLEFVIELCKPFRLDKSKTVLELGAGPGGHARAVATEFGTWVTAFEADAGLAEAAMAVSIQQGLGKRAAVHGFDLKSFLADKRHYDAMFSMEALFTWPEKAEIWAVLPKKLKDRGEVMITDFVLAAPDASGPALDAWRAAEIVAPEPWVWAQYQEVAKAGGFEVRVHEDISDSYAAMVRETWKSFESLLKPGSLDAETTEALLKEGELWHRRLAALAEGQLRVIRAHMIKR